LRMGSAPKRTKRKDEDAAKIVPVGDVIKYIKDKIPSQ